MACIQEEWEIRKERCPSDPEFDYNYPDVSEIVDGDDHVLKHGQLIAVARYETLEDGEAADLEELLEKVVVEEGRA